MRTRSLLARMIGWAMLVTIAAVPALRAQSLTNGGLRGIVTYAAEGTAIPGVQVTLEGSDGRALSYLETDGSGQFSVPLLAPGVYRVLAEQVGLQPVRYLGVVVVAGQTTVVIFRLERRPPPITKVEELQQPGASAGTTLGRTVLNRWLRDGDRFRSVTDVSRGLTEVDGPRDAREGFALSGGGLSANYNRLWVDGLPETLMRHPGAPGEPASAPLFHREGLNQVQVLEMGFDTEWRGYPGTMLAGHTLRGGNDLRFRPYGTLSSSAFGTDAKDNPADSAGMSYQVGASLSGPIIKDTANFALRLDYQQQRTPTAYPFEDAALRQALPQVAQDTYGVGIAASVAPTVRTWGGFSSMGRLDWRINRNTLAFRFGYANWTEQQPLLLDERSNLSGVELKANDLSGALNLMSNWGPVSNEIRVGLSGTKRDWLGVALPATSLVAEGIAFGNSAGLPGKFDQQVFDASDALQFQLSRHRIKVGITYDLTAYKQDYRYGFAGVYTFGSLDQFGRAEGSYFQATGRPKEAADPRIQDWGFFLQDTWTASPEIALTAGVRWDGQFFPTDKIQFNQGWYDLTGRRNDFRPNSDGISPRVGVVWNVQNRGEWILQGGAGMYRGRLDPATYSEAILYDGRTSVRRGVGSFESWPSLPDAELAPDVGPRLAYFNTTYDNPRSYKSGAGLTRGFSGGMALQLMGTYQHADHLPRRADVNRVASQVGQTQEGRPVYGTLLQQGGLVTPVPKSNRRFDNYDVVSELSPTGFSDYYEFTALLERRRETGLTFALSYTFSKTKDNIVGVRQLDPADQLNPFPEGLQGSDWAEGRSDFDVPHRAALSAEYRLGKSTPLTIGARWRYRSGLPFTPGFQPGVDINGDGAGNNDPAYLDAGLGGLSSVLPNGSCAQGTNVFAERNSCREQAAMGLDVHLSVGLPIRTGGADRLAIMLDAFNVVGTEVGITDHALLLVDPNGALTNDGHGGISVPLVVNQNFGKILSRRNDPRLVRIGIRMEY